jgi:mannose-6-phosphate isomerase-like protein (cupin superfamily)
MRLLGIVLIWICVSAVSAQTPPGATDISAADVQQFLQQLPREVASDRPIRVTDVGGYRVGIYGVFRPKASPGNAVLHETKMTEIYYVLEGGGTLVTGGALREPTARQRSKNSSMFNVTSAGIAGGVSRQVSKGDIVIIPAGVPHWWSSLDDDVTYLIIRPDPGSEQPLK